MKKILFLLLFGATAHAQITTKCAVCPPTLNGVPNGYVLRDSSGHARWQFVANDTLSQWSLSGNSGTDPSTNFVGTTDGQPFSMKSDSFLVWLYKGGMSSMWLGNANSFLGDGFGDNEFIASGDSIGLYTGKHYLLTGNHGSYGINDLDTMDYRQKVIKQNSVTYNLKIDSTEGAGKVLTSDVDGNASWQGGIVYDSLTSLTGETVTLTNNSTTIIASNGTITDVTWSFPTGSTGDVLDIENMQTITTLTIAGTGTGTITAAKITNTKTAGLKTFHNYGGNWY